MDCNELRVFNHVKCRILDDSDIYQVLGINATNNTCLLCGARNGEWIPLAEIQPIPITHEMMVEYGFELKEPRGLEWNIYAKGKFKLDEIPSLSKNKVLGYWNKDACKHVRIRYVHELENIYYILTGIELSKQS